MKEWVWRLSTTESQDSVSSSFCSEIEFYMLPIRSVKNGVFGNTGYVLGESIASKGNPRATLIVNIRSLGLVPDRFRLIYM